MWRMGAVPPAPFPYSSSCSCFVGTAATSPPTAGSAAVLLSREAPSLHRERRPGRVWEGDDSGRAQRRHVWIVMAGTKTRVEGIPVVEFTGILRSGVGTEASKHEMARARKEPGPLSS